MKAVGPILCFCIVFPILLKMIKWDMWVSVFTPPRGRGQSPLAWAACSDVLNAIKWMTTPTGPPPSPARPD